jgi:DNA-binding CsgD family transcriptional regulator
VVSGSFVGRADELAILQGLLGRLERGRGPLAAVIVGEPGMGKTRLLTEALRHLDGPRLLRLVGFEPERQVPFSAAADMLRSLTTAPVYGGRLHDLLYGGPPRAAAALEPLQLFEAAHTALTELAPAVIAFDDLHWADEMSVALCHYVFRAAVVDSAAVLICATRPGPHASSLVKSLSGAMLDDTDLVQLSLGPLDRSAGVALATDVDPTLNDEEAGRLCHVAHDSPFWIQALARRQAHPDRPGDALSEQLRAVGADPADCFAAMAVVGRPVRAAEVATILGWEPTRVDQAVAVLANRGLVSLDGSSVHLSHDLVREAASRQIPDGERRRLHRQIAAWLSAEADDDLQRLMEALEHQQAIDAPSATLALRIARSPQRRLLGLEGARRFAEIADAVDSTDAEALTLSTEVAALVGELGDRGSALERWTALAGQLPAAGERARAALEAARHAVDLKRSSEAAQLLERARVEAGDDPWVGVEADALDHARRAWVDNDSVGAQESMRRAVGAAREAVASAGSVDALDASARRAYLEALTAERDVALMTDDLDKLVRTSAERVAATRGLGEEHLVAQADAATTLWYLNRFGEAATRLTRVLDESRAQSFPALTAELCHLLAFTRYQLGALHEAGALLDEAQLLEHRTATPTRRTVPWVRGGLRPLLRASTDDWQDAVRELHSDIARTSDPHNRLRLRMWAAMCAARFGGAERRDEVTAQVQAVDTDAKAAGCLRCGWEMYLGSAELLARVGDSSGAAARLARWDEAHPVPQPGAGVQRRSASALLAAARHDREAVRLLGGVVADARAGNLKIDELWGLIDLGTAQAGVEDTAAIDAWSAALTLASAIGARSEAGLVQHKLRALGVRSPRPVRSADATPAGLTDREHDVARLVASGSRNAEIAAALFLSTKTVERHLSNVFAKLGVRSRAELVSKYAEMVRAEVGPPAG